MIDGASMLVSVVPGKEVLGYHALWKVNHHEFGRQEALP
jgi:hypothetical protein